MHQASQHQQNIADHKGSGQEVDEFEGLGVFVLQDDTRLARVLHLAEKRAELDTPFVIDEGLGEETAAIAAFEDPGAQVDVLSITHGSEAAQGFVNVFPDA